MILFSLDGLHRAKTSPNWSSSAFIAFAGSARILAQGSSANFHPNSHDTSAVDARGIRHQGSEYNGNPLWAEDRLKGVAPDYPREDRRERHQGRAIIRLMLDLKTGFVTNLAVIKSTGFRSLDNCAVVAFRQWTWRPGKWKEIDMPVTFHLGDNSGGRT